MGLAGSGAVAIWHDIAPEGREAFYAWHGKEHMPERLAIAGFLRGSRYVAVHGTPEYFNLYETSDTAVLTGADYLARLNDPTPWTRATVAHFRNVTRGVCQVAASVGDGRGGLVATFRYGVASQAASAECVAWRARAEAIGASPGIAGCHLLVADAKGSAIETTERRARAGSSGIPSLVVLVESWDDSPPFVAACAALAAGEAFAAAAVPPDWAVYRLQTVLERRDDGAQSLPGVAPTRATP